MLRLADVEFAKTESQSCPVMQAGHVLPCPPRHISDVCGEFVTVYLLLVTVVVRSFALLCAAHEVMPLSWTFFVTFDFPVS